jgi:hypothetical protein
VAVVGDGFRKREADGRQGGQRVAIAHASVQYRRLVFRRVKARAAP